MISGHKKARRVAGHQLGVVYLAQKILRLRWSVLAPLNGLSGTGHWLQENAAWLQRETPKLNRTQARFLREGTFYGNEIVSSTRRMCLMNLFLDNIGELYGEPAIERSDALISEPKIKVNYVLANHRLAKRAA